ncbi:NAD-dependent epimerase/dehydratase family protein [Paenibacillus filicis]|uniref:NAD-dependent epimerase/dehydratase family protein n=1 Tax=Paenibacillus gyeongsangnamensis TaxID=3388067 RepID=A0ABT4Q9U9_9BACL|nr:NAD-dependent epimerase/dehydratase family protein [Paenibacillus filicis]MCZ8513599.1 NAD-dependent epimerase/dehydratase family protein [Paenibacillus filicis]
MDADGMTAGRIVITGASGFTGKHACSYFAAQGYEVVAAVRRPGTAALHGGGEVREAVCDLSSPVQVSRLLEGERPDMLLHLAGLNSVSGSWEDPLRYMGINVMSTLYLLDALQRAGSGSCRVLVIGSMLGFRLSDGAPPQPPHPYSLSKTLQTLSARAWGTLFRLPVMIAQPSNLIGPGLSNGICGLIGAYVVRVERGLHEPAFRLSSTTEVRDFVDVRDAVRAYELILRSGTPGAVYPIGSGRLRTLGEVAGRFEALAATPIGWRIGSQADTPLVSLAPQPQPETGREAARPPSSGTVPVSPVDPAPMRSLGWQPVIPFEQSAEEILAFFRNGCL